VWAGSHVQKEAHCLTVKFSFLSKLRLLRSLHLGPWLACGDFNLIYGTTDKNNLRLNRSLMLAFLSTQWSCIFRVSCSPGGNEQLFGGCVEPLEHYIFCWRLGPNRQLWNIFTNSCIQMSMGETPT
jgi:hypothetical protein